MILACSSPKGPLACLGSKMLALLMLSLAGTGAVSAQPKAIDIGKSAITIKVYKAGLLSAMGHDHEINAPITRGTVDTSSRQVELHSKAGALQVRDPNVSDKDRAEIQKTMLGPKVLDTERYPEIIFRSTSAEPTGAGSWRLNGNLTLHGETHIVEVQVREAGGHYVGVSMFKQTEFGIEPVKAGGGSVRVKNQVRIEFDIQLEP